MKIKEIKAKSILCTSALPGDDFVINPYSGCEFGCVYCYASFMRRFTGHLQDEWGKYVDVKINAAEVLDKEVQNLIKKFQPHPAFGHPLHRRWRGAGGEVWKGGLFPNVLISSVCDPYQSVEAKYKITRSCLEVFANNNFPGEISILTKSPLVTRDIDVLKKLKKVSVGMTITSTDDAVGRLFEQNAPLARSRIVALEKLNKAGLKTYACINPMLPHFVTKEKELIKLFNAIKHAGTNEVFIEHLNVTRNNRKRLLEKFKDAFNDKIIEEIWLSQTDNYKRKLEKIVYSIIEQQNFKVLGGGIIDHEKIMGKGGTHFVTS